VFDLEVDTNIGSHRLTCVLERIIKQRGTPLALTPELMSRSLFGLVHRAQDGPSKLSQLDRNLVNLVASQHCAKLSRVAAADRGTT